MKGVRELARSGVAITPKYTIEDAAALMESADVTSLVALAPDVSGSVSVMRRSADGLALSRAAAAFRVGHSMIAVGDLAALSYVWLCVLRRRRDAVFKVSVAALIIEGGALVVGRGNCPLGPLQRQLGDVVPLFELVLPPKAAKAAVPVLASASVIGIALALVRPPKDNVT